MERCTPSDYAYLVVMSSPGPPPLLKHTPSLFSSIAMVNAKSPPSHHHDIQGKSYSSLWTDRSCKKVMHRVWAYFHARLAFTMTAFNVLVQWHGLRPNASGFVPLSIAEFSL